MHVVGDSKVVVIEEAHRGREIGPRRGEWRSPSIFLVRILILMTVELPVGSWSRHLSRYAEAQHWS